jgi:hypothetical protein
MASAIAAFNRPLRRASVEVIHRVQRSRDETILPERT